MEVPASGREWEIVVQAQATVFSRLKRRPWLAAACVVLSMIAMGYFTIIFPAERSAGKVKIALEKGFPGTRFVVGTAVAPDTLAHYIEVEVSFVVEERKQLEMREWLARWKFDHDLNFPVALRFRDPEYPYEKYPDHPRWLNQLVF
jgi:hypothetical protein